MNEEREEGKREDRDFNTLIPSIKSSLSIYSRHIGEENV